MRFSSPLSPLFSVLRLKPEAMRETFWLNTGFDQGVVWRDGKRGLELRYKRSRGNWLVHNWFRISCREKNDQTEIDLDVHLDLRKGWWIPGLLFTSPVILLLVLIATGESLGVPAGPLAMGAAFPSVLLGLDELLGCALGKERDRKAIPDFLERTIGARPLPERRVARRNDPRFY